MPIYEYENMTMKKGCDKCLGCFEVIQKLNEKKLSACPDCGHRVRKIVSRCGAVVVENSAIYERTEKTVRAYEKNGMWSHAAELADTCAEKFRNKELQNRAMEDYHKAGYEATQIDNHQKTTND